MATGGVFQLIAGDGKCDLRKLAVDIENLHVIAICDNVAANKLVEESPLCARCENERDGEFTVCIMCRSTLHVTCDAEWKIKAQRRGDMHLCCACEGSGYTPRCHYCSDHIYDDGFATKCGTYLHAGCDISFKQETESKACAACRSDPCTPRTVEQRQSSF